MFMSARYISIDRNIPMLFPPDLREWVSPDDPVHYIIEVMEGLPCPGLHSNERGSGSAQYPPSMMLALLVYCYSRGIFSSRKIEEASWRDVGVRYLCANTHPDHDTICVFRRTNGAAIRDFFAHTLVMAREIGLAKVGIVSVDGTLIKANASKARNVTYKRTGELDEELGRRIDELLAKAEAADEAAQDERLPKDLAEDHQRLRKEVAAARARIEARAQAHADAMASIPVKERRGRNDRKHPTGKPEPTDRDNLTDPDSRIMRKNQHTAYQQSYNAQAVVDAQGSQLILATRISQSSNDGCELAADIDAIPHEAGRPHTALADSGYASEAEVALLEARGMDIYVSVKAQPLAQFPLSDKGPQKQPSKKAQSPFGVRMSQKLATPEGAALYRRRKHTIEPVFGIIKSVLGFTHFHLRGLEKVQLEWNLVALAYNIKRLHNLNTSRPKPGKGTTSYRPALPRSMRGKKRNPKTKTTFQRPRLHSERK